MSVTWARGVICFEQLLAARLAPGSLGPTSMTSGTDGSDSGVAQFSGMSKDCHVTSRFTCVWPETPLFNETTSFDCEQTRRR